MQERQELILGSIIKEYVDSAIPIGSSLLFEKYDFGVSPATIRAEMQELENKGYLYQPHTSSGRIPTDKGFRYFVDELMREKELTKREQNSLQVELLRLKAQNKMLARTTAKLLSSMSGNLAISGIIDSDDFYKSGIQNLLSQPEFGNLDSVCKIAEVFDYLDESIDDLSKELKNKSEVEVFIGKESPISKTDDCSIVVSKYNLKSGEEGLLAIIGPKRMKYSRNVSLIDYLKKLLGEG
jgi:transcriptional regulator of heat shock response